MSSKIRLLSHFWSNITKIVKLTIITFHIYINQQTPLNGSFPVTKKMQNLRDEPACHKFLQRFPRLIVGNTTTAMSFASYNAKNVEHIIYVGLTK